MADSTKPSLRPLPTMMPGAVVPPPRPARPQRSGTLAERPIRPALPIRPILPARAADTAQRCTLGADQVRHLATQHALTFHHRDKPDLEDLLDTAVVIERYIATGELPEACTEAARLTGEAGV